MTLSRFFSIFSWFLLLVLSIPSFFILLSWNSLPGDTFYPVKRGLENILVAAVSPNQELATKLYIKYSERRFTEGVKLLTTKYSVTGLIYFSQALETTKQEVLKTSDPQAKEQLKEQMVSQLLTYNNTLEKTKIQLVQALPPPYFSPTATVVPAVPMAVSPTPTPSLTPIPRQESKPAMVKASPTTTSETVVVTQPTFTESPKPQVTATTFLPQEKTQAISAIIKTQAEINRVVEELKEDKHGGKMEKKEEDKIRPEQKKRDHDNEPKEMKKGPK